MGIGDTAFVVQLRNDSYLTIGLIVEEVEAERAVLLCLPSLLSLRPFLICPISRPTSKTRRDMTGRFSSAKGQVRSNKKRESRKSKASSSGCINIWKKVKRATAMYGYRPPISQLTIAPQEHGVGQVRGKDGTREI